MRRAGVILHPTSLPGPYGTGEIGEHAYAFVDWLQSAGMQAWQVHASSFLLCACMGASQKVLGTARYASLACAGSDLA